MPSGSTAPSDSRLDGQVMEARAAQLWFWEGYFSRWGINLQRHFDPEPLLVTDLDLLAYDFTPTLSRRKFIGETKTGTSKNTPKPLDRAIWLRGLRALVEAEAAELTSMQKPSARIRQLAADLGVTAQSVEDLERRERAVRISEVSDVGSQGPTSLTILKSVHRHCSSDVELERAFWFLRSEVWFQDPWSATKQTIGLLKQLSRRWTPRVEDEDAESLRWLFAEAITVFSLNLITLAADSIALSREQFSVLAAEKLAEGVIPAHQMRRVSESIDKYLAGVLVAAKAPATIRAEAMGAFVPRPPDFTDQLIEISGRVASSRLAARNLPRQLDLLLFERLVRRRHVPPIAVERLQLADEEATRLRRLLAAFLRGVVGLPDPVDRALVAPALLQTDSRADVDSEISPNGLAGPPSREPDDGTQLSLPDAEAVPAENGPLKGLD